MPRILKSLLLILLFSNAIVAQTPKRWTSSDIYAGLEKLNFLGSALYVAAHPDDENTRMISWLANVRHANTAYLSLTRGDGGQNLIGTEIRELLGVIRTQELLAARRIDGGQQYFSRANDFGFSKHPDETFNIWDKDQVLADAVWVIRTFQPDIIINRFDHRSPGRTHGHHTASAVIGLEAFEKSADAAAYPEQLQLAKPWQAERIFFNTSWWHYGSQEAFDAADKSNMMTLDLGTYLPHRGESVPEIAARSRSQHSSQGFGSAGARGEQLEYIELIGGNMPQGVNDPFAGINTTWTRVQGGAPIGMAVQALLDNFDFNNPANHLSALLDIHNMIKALPDSYWKRVKLEEVNELIQAATGLFLEVVSPNAAAAPGQTITLDMEAANRASSAQVVLERVKILPSGIDSVWNANLAFNKRVTKKISLVLPNNSPLTNAYWLNEPATVGMYAVSQQDLRGQPQSPAGLHAEFTLRCYNERTNNWETVVITKPILYKTTSSDKGELYNPFEITPPASVAIADKVLIFADNTPREIQVKVLAARDGVNGTLRLNCPTGWSVKPATHQVQLEKKDQEGTYSFTLTPPANANNGSIHPVLELGDYRCTQERIIIQYDHIPTQTIYADAKAEVVRLDIAKAGQKVGYLMGAGDEIPAALEQIGYNVTLLDDKTMQKEALAGFDAILLGVRAYNTVDRIKAYQPLLMDYVQNGGTLIVQYNTNNRDLIIPAKELAPYPFTITRERVTVEDAPITMLAPTHPVLNTPNKITAADFDGWVQERGLYFLSDWDAAYTPILACNDPGEPSREGGLLVAQYGKGWYVYTGYSWFRQLPAGVPGAYRLFANLISLGN